MTAAAEQVQAVVIGGGVTGCAVLRELTRRGVESLLVEAEPDLCEGTSKANSAIVHTGFDAHEGTVEASMLRRAATLWPDVVEELSVPFLDVGAVMLARSEQERVRLGHEVAANAARLGVRTELLDRAALRELAPYVTDDAVAGLLVPGEGVIDPFWLTRAYADAALAGGAHLWLGRAVTALGVGDSEVLLGLSNGSRVRAEQVFDCAGLRADEVAGLAGDDSFSLHPRKGQFLVSEETFGVDRIVLPLPSPTTKGMLVTPIVFGGLLIGPTAEEQDDRDDRSVDGKARARILDACAALVPVVREMVPVRQFAGLRHVSSTGDYVLGPSPVGDRLIHAAGIRSTGISASPAVAEHVVELAARLRGWDRRAATRPSGAVAAAPSVLFTEEPGELVCHCRWVSRGEIEGACRQPTQPSTVDAIKRRSGATFGDCQGNLCTPAVAQIVARERGRATHEILKHREGSWLFAPAVGSIALAAGLGSAGMRSDLPEEAELVIVGAGLAGAGVARAALEQGLRPVVVERASRAGGAFRGCPPQTLGVDEQDALEGLTSDGSGPLLVLDTAAAGLVYEGDRWLVQLQTSGGGKEVRTRTVVLATGGYVQPREHLPVTGPRGSGVMTADLAHAALDAGLLPGRRALVVGRGRYADATAERLRAAGLDCAVAEPRDGEGPVDEVRGERRLEAVRIGETWHQADTLVLAHRLLAAPLLLRPLALVDGRPGIPAPADESGATPLPGLFACGTTVRPDIDHRSSLGEGLELGRRLVALSEAAR